MKQSSAAAVMLRSAHVRMLDVVMVGRAAHLTAVPVAQPRMVRQLMAATVVVVIMAAVRHKRARLRMMRSVPRVQARADLSGAVALVAVSASVVELNVRHRAIVARRPLMTCKR